MTETPERYSSNGLTLEESLARWSEGIPEALRPPAEGTPRARILEAAARHFARDGFSRSTTRAIAESAGVNQAMIHYYFQSKKHLYERVMAGMVVHLLSSLAASIGPRAASPVDALVQFPERIIEVFAADPIRVAILRREMGSGAPHLREVVDQLGMLGPRGFSTIIIEYIEAARGSGALVPGPASSILEFLLVHAYGALLVEPMLRHLFRSGDTAENLTVIVESQRDLVRRALTHRPKEDQTT